MLKMLMLFVLGMVSSFETLPAPPPKVLAAVEIVTPTPTPSPTILPTVKPTKIPTPTLKPTLKPTAFLTPIPTPTITIKPTPLPANNPTALPTLVPTALPSVKAPAWMEPIFTEYAQKYKVDVNLLKKIADCESHFNTGVVSQNGLYAGMYQFAASTWSTNRKRIPADPNPDLRFGAREAIETAAFMIGQGQANAWPTCSK